MLKHRKPSAPRRRDDLGAGHVMRPSAVTRCTITRPRRSRSCRRVQVIESGELAAAFESRRANRTSPATRRPGGRPSTPEGVVQSAMFLVSMLVPRLADPASRLTDTVRETSFSTSESAIFGKEACLRLLSDPASRTDSAPASRLTGWSVPHGLTDSRTDSAPHSLSAASARARRSGAREGRGRRRCSRVRDGLEEAELATAE
jgi:hypothetical protein